MFLLSCLYSDFLSYFFLQNFEKYTISILLITTLQFWRNTFSLNYQPHGQDISISIYRFLHWSPSSITPIHTLLSERKIWESQFQITKLFFLYKYYLDFSILFGLFQHYFIYPSLLPWIHLQEKSREMDLW